MNSSTTTLTLDLNEGFFSRRNWADWVFAVIVLAGGAFALAKYANYMDVYEKGILIGSMPAAIWLGWFWRPSRNLMLAVGVFALLGVLSYQGSLERSESVFWLKYFLSSQSAILWAGVLFFMSTAFYWLGVFSSGREAGMERIGTMLAWAATGMALVGTLVRWYEG
mgnify:FL=1